MRVGLALRLESERTAHFVGQLGKLRPIVNLPALFAAEAGVQPAASSTCTSRTPYLPPAPLRRYTSKPAAYSAHHSSSP